jgi:L-rhamnose isomerase / sugar isomerase
LQDAYRSDVRQLVRESRLKSGAAADPVKLFRELGVRDHLIEERGSDTVATGL